MAYVTFAERYGVEKGIKIGNEQGIKIGNEQGIKIGTEQGIGQGILIVATNLLKEGLKPILIEKVTGLSQEKIKDLELTLEKSH